MAKRTRKGGYVSWNPLNWFKAAPETVPEAIQPTGNTTVEEPIVTSTDTTTTTGSPSPSSNFSIGARRKTRRGGRRGVKKTRSGKTSNRR